MLRGASAADPQTFYIRLSYNSYASGQPRAISGTVKTAACSCDIDKSLGRAVSHAFFTGIIMLSVLICPVINT